MPRDIEFPDVRPRYVFERDSLGFPAVVDGKRIECLVTGELLLHRFGARAFTEDAFREAFAQHEVEIHRIAREHIERGWINSENLVILTTRFTTLKVTYDVELGGRPRELEAANRAEKILAELIGPGSGAISVTIALESNGDGPPVLVVTLEDPFAWAAQRFDAEDFSSFSKLRMGLTRLWSDFLLIRSHKLIQRFG